MTRLDVPKIEQTLNNLIGNAIKFSPRGSHIVVTLKVAGADAIISIKDEGQGIRSGELERLFKPFTTGRAKTTGGERSTGLGLAIVKRIIEGHGGRISVKSEEGKGATFTVTLPLRS
jgi:signal transduction histidine kinase